jgi:hypothetical protein
MRCLVRMLPTAAALVMALVLAGCGTSSVWDGANSMSDKFSDMMHDFNPFGTAKKPLPGERRAVFPEGVPGVQQGVPPELLRQNPQVGDVPPQPAAEPRPPAPKSGRQTAKARTQSRGAQPAEAEPQDPAQDEVWPPPPRR